MPRSASGLALPDPRLRKVAGPELSGKLVPGVFVGVAGREPNRAIYETYLVE
jgi:hypothetical protein